MKLREIIQKEGIEKSPSKRPKTTPRRRYFWDEDEKKSTIEPSPIESSSNGVQLGCESSSESSSNGVQLGCESNKQKTKWGAQWGSDFEQLGCESSSNGVQNSLSAQNSKSVLTLRGEQRRIIDFFFELCLSSGEKTTPCVSTSDLLKALQIGRNSARTAIKRLIARRLYRANEI